MMDFVVLFNHCLKYYLRGERDGQLLEKLSRMLLHIDITEYFIFVAIFKKRFFVFSNTS